MKSSDLPYRVVLGLVMSTLVAVLIALALPARAHEVRPAIADMTQDGSRLVFDVRLNLEGVLAGIDLSAVADTNEAAEADRYDALRALSDSALADEARADWPGIAAGIGILAGPDRLTPMLSGIVVEPQQNTDLPRDTILSFTVDLPAGADAVTVGWARSYGTLVLRQQGVDDPYTGYLEAGATSDPILLTGGGAVGGWEAFVRYIPVGVDHIVPKGLDHILFVLGLFFLAARLRPLLWQVSAFTLAHTITLAAAALGLVSIPASIVEPLIAASIVYVAVENLFTDGLSRWRPFVIFGFGLLHGLGFASVLAEFGLPQGAFIPALIGFNVGVELGQLLVIAVMALCVLAAVRVDRGQGAPVLAQGLYVGLAVVSVGVCLWSPSALEIALENPAWVFFGPLAAVFALSTLSIRSEPKPGAYRRFVAIPASLFIAAVGTWWVIERVFL